MPDSTGTAAVNLVDLAADIVSAYVSRNSLSATELPQLIGSVHTALANLGAPAATEPEARRPAVPVRRSVTPDHIVCLEDGRKFRSLKRHLRAEHNLSPEEYRQKWSLPHDYPMVAPNYSAVRSQLAKELGLGSAPAPRAEPENKPRRRRAPAQQA